MTDLMKNLLAAFTVILGIVCTVVAVIAIQGGFASKADKKEESSIPAEKIKAIRIDTNINGGFIWGDYFCVPGTGRATYTCTKVKDTPECEGESK